MPLPHPLVPPVRAALACRPTLVAHAPARACVRLAVRCRSPCGAARRYFRSLDLRRFKKPTKHTAHMNTEDEQKKKRQKTH